MVYLPRGMCRTAGAAPARISLRTRARLFCCMHATSRSRTSAPPPFDPPPAGRPASLLAVAVLHAFRYVALCGFQ
jgi:hypothetical protein